LADILKGANRISVIRELLQSGMSDALEAAVVPTMMQSRDEGAYTVTGEEADHHPKSRRADRYLDMSHGNLATLEQSPK